MEEAKKWKKKDSFCYHCGRKLEGNDYYCLQCGILVRPFTSASQEILPFVQETPSRLQMDLSIARNKIENGQLEEEMNRLKWIIKKESLRNFVSNFTLFFLPSLFQTIFFLKKLMG